MKKIEKHLQTFLEKNESSIYELETEVNNLTAEILDLRQRINTKLEELETLVKTEGYRIYKEEGLINAIRNFYTFLETVLKYGTDTQKFLVCKKSLTQFKPYADQISEKYEQTESVTVHLEIGTHVHDILSHDFSSIVKLEIIPERMHFPCIASSSSSLYSCIIKPLAERQVKLEKVMEIQSVGKMDPMYSGIVHLPDGCVVLTDFKNKTCCLYDNSYIIISSYKLHESPYDVCLMEHNEVAVTYSNKTA
ncbi:hypothetical protein CHS0354_012750 [Potamilus streckersoni]|uniref:Uncharacterized protein n=1 Tax=Potamilus streckersoni TaxID=2493646 RepID=A0AAE0RV31_9BIVA|nr:hypothetical protein CHS0354_012750 [Potamilus streckersoni]